MDRSRGAGVRGILFTDMVGSSGLRSRLGDDRADELRRDHDAILGAAVTSHGGQVVRWTGDGLKAQFLSASAAVAAAIDMQRAVERYAQGADAVAPFQIRIGLSAGEVIEEDDDIHGVSVIEGARLEAMAAPGEILATDLVQRLGQRRVDAEFDAAGTHTLKGLEQPVTILRVIDTANDRSARPVPPALALDRRFPLVGRGDELAAVLRRWDEVRSGTPATVLVAGAPGIGKSRLLAQVADRAHADGAVVLAGVCDSELAVPYQPFSMAFSEVVGDDELTAAMESGTGPLGPLFPAGRSGRFEDAGPSARFELFQAVVDLIDRLAREQPVVVALEDMQWAALPTVQLLRHLVRHSIKARTLLLVSYRIEDVGPSHPLQELLVGIHASAAVTKLELGALRLPDITDLIADQVPAAPEESVRVFARRMRDESGGSPFFVCELLHHMSVTGELEQLVGRGTGAELPIPDSVRDVVVQRLGRLPADAAELLSTAAVIGLTFDLQLLAEVVGEREEDVLRIVEDAERVALVREVEAARFSFAHAIVRTTLLERVSATRRARAHRRVAEAIEKLRGTDHDELAHHWLLAGDEERADLHLELAARRDLEALAYESAAERYLAVLDYRRNQRTPDPEAMARAWLGLGLARRAMGQTEYIVAIEEAGRLGRRLRDADVVAEAALASIWPGNFFVTAGRTQPQLVELGEDAIALVGPDDPRRARLLSTLAAHLTFDVDRDRRVALLAEALDLARRTGDPEEIGSVLVAEYLVLWDPTTFLRRADISRELGRMARASGDVDLEFFAGFFAAIGALERCDVADARRRLERLAGPVTASQNFYFGFLTDRLLISLDVLTGRPGVQTEIDALAERYGDTHADTGGTWSLQTGGVAYQAGTLGDLVPALRTMVEESDIASNWTPPYGVALLESGDRAAAAEVLDTFEEPILDFFWLTTMQGLAELAVGLGRRDVMRWLFDLLFPYREQLGIVASGSLCLGLVATTLGQLALSLGDDADAIELLDDAVERADAMDAPFESVKARRLLAGALLSGDRAADRVESIVECAAELAAQHGFHAEQVSLAALAERSALR